MTNTQYHKKFRNINPKAINLVKEIIKKGLFKSENSNEFKQNLILDLHKKMCEVYKIPQNRIFFNSGSFSHYNQISQNITLENNSLITYLHEFRHYFEMFTTGTTSEDTARGYSISLYYLATPKLYKNAVEKGLIIHQKKILNEVIK